MTAPRVPAVEVAVRTDPGRDPMKQINEDSAAHVETRIGHLVFVCDGMGGHEGGREASTLAQQVVTEFVATAKDDDPPREVLRDAIAEANRRVWGMSTGDVSAARAGSTCVAALLHARGTEVAHIGDSRCYAIHQGEITQVTKDHSMVQELVDSGVLTPAQAEVHPDANMITRALGMGAEAEVESRPTPIVHVAGDAFVLCSDGLSDLVLPREILGIVGTMPAAQAAGQLVDLANARGGHDNITVVILRARESAVVTADPAAPLSPTVVQTEAERATRAAVPTTQVDPLPTARSIEEPRPRARMPIAVVLGVVLGTLGVAALGGALYVEMKSRHRATAAVPLTITMDASPPPTVILTPPPIPSAIAVDPVPAVSATPSAPRGPIMSPRRRR